MKRTKRYFSLVLSLLMILTAFVIPSHAQTDSNQDNQVTLIDETFDLGWKGLMNPDRISWVASGGSAQITDSGWSALQIVDADIIKDKDIFTVSVDIQFTTLKSTGTTLMGIIYENNASTNNININSGIAMLRSNNAGDLYFLHGGYKNGTAKYLMSDGTLSGGAGTAANFPQLAKYYPDAGNTGYWINLSLTVNKSTQTCTAYLNGKEVNKYTGFTVINSGLYFMLQQNSGTMVDNLKITGADNSVIYEEDFSSTESGPLPMIREGTSSANGSITQSLTEEALSIKDSGWCIYQLAPLEQLKGALTYTLTAKIRLDDFSKTASHIAFRFNQAGDGAVKAGINNTSLVQLYKTSSDIQLIGGNRNSSGWVSSGSEGAKTTKSVADVVKVGTWFNLSITVDNTAKTCVVVLSDGTNTITQTYENIYVNDSNLSMVFQTQSCLIDDLKLTATYEKALDMLGVQVTTEVNETYGLRFSSRLRTGNISDYSAIGMTIVADYEGGSKEFVGEDTTVYLAIQGNEDGVLKSYRAKDYGATYLFCVTIEDIPADLGTITYTVTPFLKTLSGDTITFDTCTVTVVNGAVAD